MPDGSAQRPPSPVVVGHGMDDLARIRLPGIELALWRRDLPAPLAEALATLDPAGYPDGRVLARPPDLATAIGSLIAPSALAGTAAGRLLAADIEALAQRFAALFAAAAVDIRLEALGHDACWKFHRDHVPARLVTTYAGPGTEWVLPAHGASALDDQKDYTGPMERLAAGEVALFRGCQPGHDHGIVHRSPPVAGTGITRLFLCLNLPSPASPGLWRV